MIFFESLVGQFEENALFKETLLSQLTTIRPGWIEEKENQDIKHVYHK